MKKTTTSSLALASAVVAALGACKDDCKVSETNVEMEKCYGIAKAGKNDCASSVTGSSCAGSAKIDGDPNSWMYVPEGLCDRIVGGSLTHADHVFISDDHDDASDGHDDAADHDAASSDDKASDDAAHALLRMPGAKIPQLV